MEFILRSECYYIDINATTSFMERFKLVEKKIMIN